MQSTCLNLQHLLLSGSQVEGQWLVYCLVAYKWAVTRRIVRPVLAHLYTSCSICVNLAVALMTDLMYRMSKYWIKFAYRKLVSYLSVS